MQHYRLLRNNSESGPYTQQDLINLGLKEYDLIWMEGKSSSWKYPSEIEGLKAYAPPVTEDLYVIFHTPKQVRQPVTTTTNNNNTKPAAPANSKTGSRRYVSVILPSAGSAEAITPKPRIEPAIPANVTTTVSGITHSTQTNLVSIHAEKVAARTEEFQADSSIAFPEPVSHKSATNRYLLATAFLLLLATGIYFGTESREKSIAAPDNADRLPANLVSLTSSVEEPVNTEERLSLPPNKQLDFAAVKRFVQVTPAKFKVGFFGGIGNLSLLVKNSGTARLTNIVIAVDYLNADKTIDYTENISIPALDPQKTISVDAPDSQKGIAIQTRIIGINNLSK